MRTITPLFFLLITGLLFCSGCIFINDHSVKGSGNVITEERNVGTFQKLEVKGSMDVYLTQGPVKSAIITAEDNIVPLIELINNGGDLEVRFKKNTSISTKRDVKIYLTVPNINEVGLFGSGGIRLENKFNLEGVIEFSSAGSGDVSGEVNAPGIKISMAGSGDVTLRGETRDAEINIAGSGDYEGADLMAENAKVSIAGSGNATVHASVKLDANIIGSGDVRYKGTPQVSSNVVGSGAVQKIN
jgi:cytoskeletal protein CcmA (bactofilin family)